MANSTGASKGAFPWSSFHLNCTARLWDGEVTAVGVWETGVKRAHHQEPIRTCIQNNKLMRDIVSLVNEKTEAFVKARRLGTHKASVEYKESRKKLKQGVRRLKGVTKKHWPAGLRKIPRLFIQT